LGTYLLAPVVRMTGPHIWTFVALELLVSAYLGWKTSDHILSDMLIAGTLYAAMIDMTYPVAPEVHTTLMALVRILSYLVIGSLGIIGAILGRLLRLRFTPTETQKTPA